MVQTLVLVTKKGLRTQGKIKMINVTYYYSACVGITTSEIKILTDPWFTDGILDGSWYQYPKIENPVPIIGQYDLIYISHIHDDHFDPAFLKKYLEVYPKTEIIIPNFKENYLAKKMTALGFDFKIVSNELVFGPTHVNIFPNELFYHDIDSALVVKRMDHSVVNMNDNLFNEVQLTQILKYINHRPKIALLPYTGGGPYPHTYVTDKELLVQKSQEKKQHFFKQYLKMRDFLNPEATIPFAGKFVLCGKNSHLNPYRGVADAVEVRSIDSTAVVLEDGGQASINTRDLAPTKERLNIYSKEEVERYCQKFKNAKMTYDVYFENLDLSSVPFTRLLNLSYKHAISKTKYENDYYFCFETPHNDWFVCNVNTKNPHSSFEKKIDHLEPRSEVRLDSKYLFGLITGVFHWNSAQSGAHLKSTRVPDIFIRDVEIFIYFFHV